MQYRVSETFPQHFAKPNVKMVLARIVPINSFKNWSLDGMKLLKLGILKFKVDLFQRID